MDQRKIELSKKHLAFRVDPAVEMLINIIIATGSCTDTLVHELVPEIIATAITNVPLIKEREEGVFMGWLDFLFKREPTKPTKVQRPSATPPKEYSIRTIVHRQISKPELEKVPAVEDTVQQPVSESETKKKVSIKVSNHDEIENSIQLESESNGTILELYCAVQPARIFCHSELIDKLGDLTKFIISSLYTGYSIEEISDLTRMGSTTIKEEIEYLIRGGLINEDEESLTELGSQYGRLLEIFDELSEGIGVAFNTFAIVHMTKEIRNSVSDFWVET